ncbi:MAG: GNAT family N-acetyltransferase [Spirochaetales bacterium]
MLIRELLTEGDLTRAFPVVKELRPLLTLGVLLSAFPVQRAEGYRLFAAEAGGEVTAVIGWRVQTYLHSGKTLYVDDLVTATAHRGKGYARALLDHAEAAAREAGCRSFSLDSGHQRFDAHRVYLNSGLRIVSHHFAKDLEGTP